MQNNKKIRYKEIKVHADFYELHPYHIDKYKDNSSKQPQNVKDRIFGLFKPGRNVCGYFKIILSSIILRLQRYPSRHCVQEKDRIMYRTYRRCALLNYS